MFRAVITDILGIANITDITDVADIVTDIADIATDIADIVNIRILRWKQVGAYEVLPRCPVTERSSQNRRCGGFGKYKVVAELLQTIRENKWKG